MTLLNLIMCICCLFIGWLVGVGVAVDIKDIEPEAVFVQFFTILLCVIGLYMIYSYCK